MKSLTLILFLAYTTLSASTPFEDALQRVLEELDPQKEPASSLSNDHRDQHKEKAIDHVVHYYRTKPFDLSILEIPIDGDFRIQEAEQILYANQLTLLDKTDTYRNESGKIVWDRNTSDSDKEWSWMLNRHDFLVSLWYAFERTGDKAYLQEINRVLKRWIQNNPYPSRLSFSPQWRALEAARRTLNSWVFLFYSLQPYDEFEKETRILMLASIIDHAHLFENYASFWGGNHLLTEMRALQTLAFAWPEFKNREEQLLYAEDRFSEEIFKQTYPDGSYKELSNHYHRVVLVNAHEFLKIYLKSQTHITEDPIYDRIKKMWDFFYLTMRPNGFGPHNNASDLDFNLGLLRNVADFYQSPEWANLNSLENLPPLTLFPWAGQAILRNHRDQPTLWAHFNFGPYGTAHQHEDRLHLSVDFGNNPFLVDNGRYHYIPDEWSTYFKGPAGHNTLTINGKGPNLYPRSVNSPLPVVNNNYIFNEHTWITVQAESQFSSDNEFATPHFRHQRTLLFAGSDFIIVFDRIISFGKAKLNFTWHFHPNHDLQSSRAGITLINPQDHSILRTERRGEESPVAGWYSVDYNQKAPAWQFDYLSTQTKPSAFFWLIQNPENTHKYHLTTQETSPGNWALTLIQNNQPIHHLTFTEQNAQLSFPK